MNYSENDLLRSMQINYDSVIKKIFFFFIDRVVIQIILNNVDYTANHSSIMIALLDENDSIKFIFRNSSNR